MTHIIDCLRIEIDKLREQGTPEAAIHKADWKKMNARIKASPYFDYHEEFAEMYEILYRHLKFYRFPEILGEEFVFVQMILASQVWDYPEKYQLLKEDKQDLIQSLYSETEEDCIENNKFYEDAYKFYGYRSITDLYWRCPSSAVVHYREQLSTNIPVGFSYCLCRNELDRERTSKIDRMIRYIQPEYVGLDHNRLLESAPIVAKKLLRTTPILGEDGRHLVKLTFEWLCAQSQFVNKIQRITDELSTYTFDEFLDVFFRLASTYEKLDSAYQDYLWSYNRYTREKINSPEECIRLAHKYVLSYMTFDGWISDKDDDVDGLAIFANGTCVEIHDFDYPEIETLQERAKRILRENYENIALFEYEPVCMDEDHYSEENGRVYATCAKGFIALFYWGDEHEQELDEEIVEAHFKKDYEDLVVHSVITKESLGKQ